MSPNTSTVVLRNTSTQILSAGSDLYFKQMHFNKIFSRILGHQIWNGSRIGDCIGYTWFQALSAEDNVV